MDERRADQGAAEAEAPARSRCCALILVDLDVADGVGDVDALSLAITRWAQLVRFSTTEIHGVEVGMVQGQVLPFSRDVVLDALTLAARGAA